jgi:ubiquinone/menaquinone biosynthesis C-methylase UbiE
MSDYWRSVFDANRAEAYDKRRESGPFSDLIKVKRMILWRLIKRFLPEETASPILEVGGGTGYWGIRVAQLGYRVTITDISQGMLHRARENVDDASVSDLVAIVEADAEDLSLFEESRFGAVLALGDVLSYCSDASRALKEIRRVIKTGGYLIGDVENRYGLLNNDRRVRNWKDLRRAVLRGEAFFPEQKDDIPIHQFSPPELKNTLEKAGWVIKALYPSDLLFTMMDRKLFAQTVAASLPELVELEEHLREDSSLLGRGPDIQYLVEKV